MKKLTILFVILMALNLIAVADTDKVRVTAANANIRAKAEMNSDVLLKAVKGDTFVLIAKKGEWFNIQLPAKNGSKITEGYIHSTRVEIISANQTVATVDQDKHATQPAQAHRVAALTQDKLFSDFYVKFGLKTNPKAINFMDSWLLGLGIDWGINPFLAIGVELQPYYHTFSGTDLSVNTLGANVFVNAKGGVNLGRLTPALKFLTPYIGVGLGAAYSHISATSGSDQVSNTNLGFAWRWMFGLEVVLQKISLNMEIQRVKATLTDIVGNGAQWYFLFGLRF